MRFALWTLAAVAASGQWIDYPAPGVPRNADGSVNLAAPAPRNPDGTPDLSGLWQQPDVVKYALNLAADLNPEDVPMLPAAAEAFRERRRTGSKDSPSGFCQVGVPLINVAPHPFRFLQSPGLVVMQYEVFTTFRQIFTDGRARPVAPNPTWMGYSVGRYENNSLVVETSGFHDRTWLDLFGHPASEQLRVTERFTRRDFGHMDLEITIDDPGAYSRPWTVSYPLTLAPDSELLEMVCVENNTSIGHLVGEE